MSYCTYKVKWKHFLTTGMSDVPILGTSDTGSPQVMHPYSDPIYLALPCSQKVASVGPY